MIAKYYEDKGVPLTMRQSYRLEKEILEKFSTEKLVSVKAKRFFFAVIEMHAVGVTKTSNTIHIFIVFM